MEFSISQKISRLNELYLKSESGMELSENERKEQGVLREEFIEYFKMACMKNKNEK